MKANSIKSRNYLTILLFFFSFFAFAQVGINTTTPNNNAILDVTSTATKPGGLLIPRVALTNTGSVLPLSANVAGMTVYNTATAGDVTPGYYYNDGSQWVRIAAETPSNEWSLAGNTGTTSGTNFLGTTDSQDLQMWTNNNERLRLLANGQVIINDTGAPVAGDRFTVQGNDTEYAINGYTTNSTGVYGNNQSGIGNGVFGNSSNVGVRGLGAHGAILESGNNAGYGAVAWNTTQFGGNRTGLLAIGQNLNPASFPSTGAILYGRGSGGVAFADDNDGTGLIGVGNSITTAQTSIDGSGIAGTGEKWGVVGYSTETGVNNPNDGSYSSGGGYFENGYGGFSVVAGMG